MANLSAYISNSTVDIGEYIDNIIVMDSTSGNIFNEIDGCIEVGKVYLQEDYPSLRDKIGLVDASKLYDAGEITTNSSVKSTTALYKNNLYIVGFKTLGAGLATSTDLVSWNTNIETPTTTEIISAVSSTYCNGMYAIGYSTTNSTNTAIRYSTDGVTWTSIAGSTNLTNLKVLDYTTDTSTKFVYSGDTYTYLSADFVSSSGYIVSLVCSGRDETSGTLFAFASDGKFVRISGEALIQYDVYPATNTMNAIAVSDNGILIAAGVGGEMVMSTDAVTTTPYFGGTWTTISSGTTEDILTMKFVDGKFIYTGKSGNMGISYDYGQTWVQTPSGTYLDIKDFDIETIGGVTVVLAVVDTAKGKVYYSEDINRFYANSYDASTEFYVPTKTVESYITSGWASNQSKAKLTTLIKAK